LISANSNPQEPNQKLTYRRVVASSDFTCSLAGTLADDALAERKQEMVKVNFATEPGSLTVAGNKSEEREMDGGKRRGIAVTRNFDQAWENAQEDL
jgi:hypothetical protein